MEIGNTRSSLVKQSSGIPQGTILGPLLFLIYINDLPQNLTSNSLLFADDLKIFARSNENVNFQNEILKINSWCKDWLLQFNTDKCKQMSFGDHNPEPLLNNSIIASTCIQGDLGVYFDSNQKLMTT